MSRRFQFSLKALLVAIVPLAVCLAVESGVARTQKDVVRLVMSKGGDVYYRHQRIKYHRYANNVPTAPAWLRCLLGDDHFQTAECLILRGDKFTDDDLVAVGHLKGLTDIYVDSGNRVTTRSLRALQATLPNCYIEAPGKL